MAIEDSVLLAFDTAAWERLAEEHPEFYHTVNGSASETLQGDALLPQGHPQVDKEAPVGDEHFLFPKQVKCPACGKSYEAIQVRASRMRLAETDLDFRPHYREFEPLWYGVWVCPHCWYAAAPSEMKPLRPAQKQRVQDSLVSLRTDNPFAFSQPRRWLEVVRSYRLAIQCASVLEKDRGKEGMHWLRLAWLYEDEELAEWAKKARATALECLEDNYTNSPIQRLPEQDQRLQLLIAELCVAVGRIEDGLRYARSAYRPKGGHPIYNKQAQDRAVEIKELRNSR